MTKSALDIKAPSFSGSPLAKFHSSAPVCLPNRLGNGSNLFRHQKDAWLMALPLFKPSNAPSYRLLPAFR